MRRAWGRHIDHHIVRPLRRKLQHGWMEALESRRARRRLESRAEARSKRRIVRCTQVTRSRLLFYSIKD